MWAFKPFLQYFATSSDTSLCQDYEEYEFVQCLLEETQIIDLFILCKLQPYKLSQCTFTTCLTVLASFRIIFNNMKNDN